ncbi:MAG: TIGR02221 family CRISPR-associated protein [Bacteroidales bacterium]|nr:TIGR02221 family CRISPR-associated protein [Bacteroidales bacterium]
MSRKVLISFLGTGPFVENNSVRNYKSARYHFDGDADNVYYETKFIADALNRRYGADKIILVGTVKSMWEEVYLSFGGQADEYYFELAKVCQNASHESKLSLPDIGRLKSTIGRDAEVVLIHYGLDAAEIETNAGIILGLEGMLESGDRLYVDVTHSFRSLPMYLMNTLIYLQNVSRKDIAIETITYGMLDVNRELGYAPVVDLKPILYINKWITGAYALKEYGNGYQIAGLLGDKNAVTDRILEFSDVMNLDHLYGIKQQAGRLLPYMDASLYKPIPGMIVPPVIESFSDEFLNEEYDFRFQYKVARWHYAHKNYNSAIIDLLESIVTFVRDYCNLGNAFEASEQAKVILGKVPGKDFKYNPEFARKKISEYLESIESPEIRTRVDSLKKFLEHLASELSLSSDKDSRMMRDRINPAGKNMLELVYTINPIRNAIAHPKDLKVITVDHMVDMLGRCLSLMELIVELKPY